MVSSSETMCNNNIHGVSVVISFNIVINSLLEQEPNDSGIDVRRFIANNKRDDFSIKNVSPY